MGGSAQLRDSLLRAGRVAGQLRCTRLLDCLKSMFISSSASKLLDLPARVPFMLAYSASRRRRKRLLRIRNTSFCACLRQRQHNQLFLTCSARRIIDCAAQRAG